MANEQRPRRLYELLAVEPQLKNQAQVTRGELRQTFEKRRHLFEEKRKTFTPSTEGAQSTVEEQSDIQSTVMSELKWIAGIWTKALDVGMQVAEGNMSARADVILDNGTVLLAAVPATALMELAHRANDIQELIASVPTLDPAKGFRPDPDKGADIFKARDVVKTRTRKVQQPLLLHPPTVEHPAQVQVISVDEPTGHLMEQEWSALITPARKSEMLARVEELRRAIKSALQRANAVELAQPPRVCGDVVFGFVLNGS